MSTADSNPSTIPPPISKSQIQKLAKRQRILEKYKREKEMKKCSSSSTPVETSQSHGPRQERHAMIREEFESNCMRGPVVVIDCGWDEHAMSEKELKSLTQQIMYSYSTNKKSKRPVRLCVVGVNEQLETMVRKLPGMAKWNVLLFRKSLEELIQTDFTAITCTYLTADTQTDFDINSVTNEDVLIIGGIVDRNRFKNATVNKANRLGIKTAKLPIGQYMQMKSSKVLTVNHVVEILTEVLATPDWERALTKVIPGRKQDLDIE